MQKLLARLFVLSVIMFLIIVGMHVIAIWNLQGDLEKTYTLSPSTEVLFLGSSEVGCSIDEDGNDIYHLRKIWVSDTIIPSCLMRLKELERQNQLNHLKMVVVPFNLNSVAHQSERGYMWGWYQELPVSWRYLYILPYGKLKFGWYILCNLRFPFMMHLADKPPARDGLSSRPEAYRRKLISSFERSARDFEVHGSSPDWEPRLFAAYKEMYEICSRHGIRFLVYKAPLLPAFEQNLPDAALRQIAVYEKRLSDMNIEYVKPEITLDENYFFDSVHLIKSGAKLFTMELFKSIDK